MTCVANDYSPAYLKDLCTLHHMDDALEKLTRDFLQFKKDHIDCLDFLDAQMLKTYEFAFFCCFFGLKTSQFLKIHKFSRSIFLKTVSEIKQKTCVGDVRTEMNFVCNLYSIVHGMPRCKREL